MMADDMTDDYIVLTDVTRRYRRSDEELAAVKNVSLSIPRGQFVGIVGHSGAGKSTLLNLIGGLDRPSSGEVIVGGTPLSTLDECERAVYRRRTVGFVFQAANLVPALTVLENVMLPLVPLAEPEAEKMGRAEAVLEQVNMAHRASHLPGELSGGEQQRAAVARAVVNDPEIVLADEPTGELDAENAGRVLFLLAGLNDEGRTVLIASHDEPTIAVTERIIRLEEGTLIGDEPHDPQPAVREASARSEQQA